MRKRNAGTVIGIIIIVLMVPILIVNMTLIVKGLINKEKVPTFGGYAPLIVLTDSMYPYIESGDLIIVKTIDAQSVKEGDVIAFFDPDGNGISIVTHRVKEIVTSNGKLMFRTKGDANNTEDNSLVPAESLVGIYVRRVPNAGNVAMFLQSTPGLLVCIGVPLVILVGSEIIRSRKHEKEKDEKTEELLKELEELRKKAGENSRSSEE